MNLGDLSDILVWGAVTAYTIAMVMFALDIARQSSDRIAVKEAVPQGADALVGASVSQATSARGSEAHSASTAVKHDVRPVDPGRNGAGTGPPRRSKQLGIAMSTVWLGAFIHLASIVFRGLAAGRAPWANMYEFSLVGAFFGILVFLIVQLRRDVRFLGVIVTGLTVAALIHGLNSYHVAATGVQPALQSYWLIIHVGIAVIAVGVFSVAFAASVLQLLRDSRENGSPFLHGLGLQVGGRTRKGAGGQRTILASRVLNLRWLDTIPGTTALEALSFRLNSVGFVMWTFTVIGGAIWAEETWGRYWGWDPKEVWSFIVWIVYAAYLHARTTRGWSGRRAAYLVLVGFATVLFNFTGVNLLFTGKHAYSGLGK